MSCVVCFEEKCSCKFGKTENMSIGYKSQCRSRCYYCSKYEPDCRCIKGFTTKKDLEKIQKACKNCGHTGDGIHACIGLFELPSELKVRKDILPRCYYCGSNPHDCECYNFISETTHRIQSHIDRKKDKHAFKCKRCGTDGCTGGCIPFGEKQFNKEMLGEWKPSKDVADKLLYVTAKSLGYELPVKKDDDVIGYAVKDSEPVYNSEGKIIHHKVEVRINDEQILDRIKRPSQYSVSVKQELKGPILTDPYDVFAFARDRFEFVEWFGNSGDLFVDRETAFLIWMAAKGWKV